MASAGAGALGPFTARLDEGLVRAYREAIGLAPAAGDVGGGLGGAVPATLVATLLWEAQEAGRETFVPAEVASTATGGVHGEHEVLLHRPLVTGEELRTWVEPWGWRPAGRNALVTLRYRTLDAGGALVAEQWWTTAYLGTTCEATGARPPDHAFPEAARARPLAEATLPIDGEMPRRYAEVSGDWSAHHFEVEAARSSGAERPFLHGLCTMALCGRAVVDALAGGDSGRLRRLAVRFAAVAPVGEQLVVRLSDGGPEGVAFEATCAGALAVAHGRAVLA